MIEIKNFTLAQWFENGDHPEDNTEMFEDSDGQPFEGEGKVVRYYRHPGIDGQMKCPHCGHIMHNHGWIDDYDNDGKEFVVCPGDFILGIRGIFYPLKKDVFENIFNMHYDDDHKWK
jgi:hypothetical protein